MGRVYCDRCDKYFNNSRGLKQHKDDSPHHYICYDCGVDYSIWDDLREHFIDYADHFFCDWCDELFDDDDELGEHYDEIHPYCDSCDEYFDDDDEMDAHNEEEHWWCRSCDKFFQGENQLQFHLKSKKHCPSNVPCRGVGCTQTFTSVSSMLLHLETGRCVSGITRGLIDKKVCELDRTNIITDPKRMLTSSASATNSSTRYYATNKAYNGTAWECYLCHGTYQTRAALNQHLASPRHQAKIYVCPSSQCRVPFTTLSALCQHIESERCGVHKFREVKIAMDGIVGQMGRLTM